MLTQHSRRYNNVDDLFFIAFALRENEFTLRDTIMLVVL